MNTEAKQGSNFRDILKLISTIVSWTIFVLLLICAVFLVYYFIAMRIYVTGEKHNPPKFSLYTILTQSMMPNINPGDVVIDSKIDNPEDIKINDVITFYADIPEVHGNTITHRVIAIKKDTDGKYYYRTKGDNNLVEDGIDIEFDNVVGKVALRIPKLGRIQNLMATKFGWFLIILIPALYIILKDILKTLGTKAESKDGKMGKLGEKLNKPLFKSKPELLPNTPQDPITQIEENKDNNPEMEIKDNIETSAEPSIEVKKEEENVSIAEPTAPLFVQEESQLVNDIAEPKLEFEEEKNIKLEEENVSPLFSEEKNSIASSIPEPDTKLEETIKEVKLEEENNEIDELAPLFNHEESTLAPQKEEPKIEEKKEITYSYIPDLDDDIDIDDLPKLK